ncbi:MAG: DUF2339 domain-containing protein [Parcubacteria group bacterium]|jgi:uncharacterized membrane protein
MSNENNTSEEIIASLNAIGGALSDLNQKVELQNERILRLEKGDVKIANTATAYAPPPPPPVSAPGSPESNYPGIDFSGSAQPTQQPVAMEKSSMEENIGGTWFARIGMAALVLGASFFLKYAFDNNWIGEVGRVMIGIIVGIILLGLGEKFIRKYFVYGQLLSGGGLAVLYLSIFAAFDFYSLIGQIPAFLMMMLITTVGIILSIRYDAISLIIVSTLGGFFTPFLISTGKNNEAGLFSYILILDLAILAVSIFKKWRWLNVLGFLATMFVFMAWAGEFYRADELPLTMFFLTLFFITYSISSLIYNLVQKEKSSGIEQLLTIMAGSVYFASSYAILDPKYHIFMGFFALILAIYYFLWAYLVRALTPEDDSLYGFLAFLTVGFVTLAIPLQFDGRVITIGWTIEAILLLILGTKTAQNAIKAFGVVVFELAFFRMLFIDSNHGSNDMVLFNKVMLTYLVVIISAYLAAYLFHAYSLEGEDDKNSFLAPKKLVATFLITANFLTIYAISREISYYYDQEIRTVQRQLEKDYAIPKKMDVGSFQPYQTLNVNQEKIKKLQNKSSVSLSLFWLLYGIILVLFGFFSRVKGVRVGGLLLFTLAILKLFFYDLWSMGTLYRIISSMSLGVVLLAISFAYQKYKDKIKEII